MGTYWKAFLLWMDRMRLLDTNWDIRAASLGSKERVSIPWRLHPSRLESYQQVWWSLGVDMARNVRKIGALSRTDVLHVVLSL